MIFNEVQFIPNEYNEKIYRFYIKANNEKAKILISHGIGEHSYRYEFVINFFLQNGFSVFAYDSAGHGQSEGIKGGTHSLRQWHNELDNLITWIRSKSSTPIITFSHSLGAFKTLSYLTKGNNLPDLMVVNSSFNKESIPTNKVQITLGKILSYFIPNLQIKRKSLTDNTTRDLRELDKKLLDTAKHSFITLRTMRILFNEASRIRKLKFESPIPLLIQHGTADLVTLVKGSEITAKKWNKNITFIPWENACHELHNDIIKEDVLNTTLNWINDQLLTLSQKNNSIDS